LVFWSILCCNTFAKQQNLSPFSIKKYFLHYLLSCKWFPQPMEFLFLFPIQLLQHGLIIIIVAGFPTNYYLVNQ
jgi:hypothetical protein